MERVRLMTWCRTCVTGMHLPAFAAAEGGAFAEYGLDVEFVPCARATDWSLRGFTTRPRAVAEGDADFALSGVAYLLAAQTDCGGRLPARFAAMFHQRNPIVGIVRADSDLHVPADLQAARAASWSIPWFAQEYAAALEHMGFERPPIVETDGDLDEALGRGDIDVIPTWLEMTLYHRKADFPIRAIPLGIEVYSTGLLAADRVAPDVASRMCDALRAGYELHRTQPDLGIEGFRRRFPDVSAQHARDNWELFAPNAFAGGAPGAMDAERWEATIAHVSAAHGLAALEPERFYRPELLADPIAVAA